MPFIMIDDLDTSGNDFDELFADVTPDELSNLIVAGVSEQLGKLVNEALRPYIYAMTGNIDYCPEEAFKPPQRNK